MKPIKFGTDGWRGMIGDDFTHENLQLVTQALVGYLKDFGLADKGVFVGYDNRLHSEDFAKTAAMVCSGAGIKTLLSPQAIPSPAVSYSVHHLGLGAGIMITASHNPPEWNGFKIKEGFGGSAFPETTKAVEERLTDKVKIIPTESNIKTFNALPEYLKKINSLTDVEFIKSKNLNIIIDAMYGSGAGLFSALGLTVTEIRNKRDTRFGGINPEPIPANLESTFKFVREAAQEHKDQQTACIVLDGDADRLAAVDATGQFINTHNVYVLLLKQLHQHRRLSGEVVKTFNLTGLIDKMCAKYALPLEVTPIGFKHIAKLMLEKDVLIGGEESGGMGLKGNIPERDGLLAGLMLLELVAREGKTLLEILNGIMDEMGYFYYNRFDLHTEKGPALVQRLSAAPPKEFSGMKVNKVETLDGLKLSFADESWILFRASGTEPLLRIYAEGRSIDEVQNLLNGGRALAR